MDTKTYKVWDLQYSYRVVCSRLPRWYRREQMSFSHKLAQAEDLPWHQAMRAKKRGEGRYRYKELPFEQFLSARVGRDYDEVYSELLQHIHAGYKAQFNFELKRLRLPNTWDGVNHHYHLLGDLYVDLRTKQLCIDEAIFQFYYPLAEQLYQYKLFCQIVTFQQLASTEAFLEEGKTLAHCVSSYRKLCRTPHTKMSIWSMSIRSHLREKPEKMLTIELRDKQIYQVRGLRNRLATHQERQYIYHWADQNGLDVRRYLSEGERVL